MVSVRNNNQGSILAAIMLHFMGNLMGQIFYPWSEITELYRVIMLTAVSVVIIVRYGSKRLAKETAAIFPYAANE